VDALQLFVRGCASLTQTSLADDMNWISDDVVHGERYELLGPD